MNITNIIKIFTTFTVTLLAITLINFKPIEDKPKTDVKEILDLPNMSDLINDEVKRVEHEAHMEELEEQRREENRKTRQVSRGTTRLVSRNNTSNKTYMHYKAITNKSSKQYQLQQHPNIYTDEEGFRKIDDSFMIAIGTYFQADVGQEVEVELDNGNKFSAIVGDIKANKHTVDNMQHSKDGSVVEFIVGDNLLPVIKKMGNCSFSEQNDFHGEIISITVLENIINK